MSEVPIREVILAEIQKWMLRNPMKDTFGAEEFRGLIDDTQGVLDGWRDRYKRLVKEEVVKGVE